MIWLKVIVEPMLIKDKRQEMEMLVKTAFKGISQPGGTCWWIGQHTEWGS